MKGKVNFIAGLLLGILLVAGTGAAATDAVTATRTTTPFYVDGVPVTMAAYNINGNNYVMLRDIGAAVGFNVYWDGNVQIDSTAPYTGKPTVPAVPKADLESVRLEMIKLVNETRRDHGAPMLATNQALMDAAQECSDKLYTWHHNREECEAVAAHGYQYGFGSNITVFTGVATEDIAKQAVENWTRSPGHFQTMIDPACDSIGVGVTEDGGRTFCYLFVGNPDTNNPYG